MKKLAFAVSALVSVMSLPALANSDAPLLVQQRVAHQGAVLPANTEVLLTMNESITTKGRRNR